MDLVIRIRQARPDCRVTESSICRWEAGKVRPQLESFRALCELFEVPADEAVRAMKLPLSLDAA